METISEGNTSSGTVEVTASSGGGMFSSPVLSESELVSEPLREEDSGSKMLMHFPMCIPQSSCGKAKRAMTSLLVW